MKKIILTFLFLTASIMATEHKVVFSLTTSKVDVLEEQLIKQVALLNKHYSKQGDSLKVAVVIYGGSYRFFLKNPEESIYADDLSIKKVHLILKDKLQSLHEKYNVAFDMCGMGMKKRGITNSMIYNFVNPAFNKNVALIKWQNKGFAHIEIE